MTFLLYLDILSIKQVRTFFFTNTCIVGHISKLSPLPNFVKGDNSLKFLIPTVYPQALVSDNFFLPRYYILYILQGT